MTLNSNFSKHLDLRGTPCPINYVRCKLALEELSEGELLKVDLDRGEPEETVIPGLRNAGHSLNILDENNDWVTFLVQSI